MKTLELLFKKSAYQQILPELDLTPGRKTCVIYGQGPQASAEVIDFGEYEIQDRGPEDNPPPMGPHYKQRKFWFFSKPVDYIWGNKKRGAVRFSDLSEEARNCVAKFSQKAALKPSTKAACYFNEVKRSVVVDLDEWMTYLNKNVVSYVRKPGYTDEPTDGTSEILTKLLK